MRRLTTERTMLAILFLLIFALATHVPVDTDTWWHIRSGEYTLSKGMIYADPFSFTKLGEPWVNHSWGSQVVIYGAWATLGNLGLALYTALLATAGMGFVYRMCEGNVYVRAFALVLGGATAAVFWSARPQMMSFLLSAVVLYLLWLYKVRKVNRLWLLPLVMWVWGNLHAGFSIGFIFMGGVIAGEILGNLFAPTREDRIEWRGVGKLILIALISVIVLVINPYGLEILKVPFQTLSIGALQAYIEEWNSPNFHDRQVWPFVALLLGTLGLVGASGRRLDWTDFVLFSGTAFMGLLAGRNIAVFAVAATPILTRHANATLTRLGLILRSAKTVPITRAYVNLLLVLLVGFAVLANLLLVIDAETIDDAQKRFLPVAVAEQIRSANYVGNMFNSYNMGGYLLFALPDVPVFVDGRTDLYGNDFLLRYLRAANGIPGWRELLDEYDIGFVVVERASGIAYWLAEEPGWRLDYEYDAEAPGTDSVIYVREEVG